jgi:hypothetical protein
MWVKTSSASKACLTWVNSVQKRDIIMTKELEIDQKPKWGKYDHWMIIGALLSIIAYKVYFAVGTVYSTELSAQMNSVWKNELIILEKSDVKEIFMGVIDKQERVYVDTCYVSFDYEKKVAQNDHLTIDKTVGNMKIPCEDKYYFNGMLLSLDENLWSVNVPEKYQDISPDRYHEIIGYALKGVITHMAAINANIVEWENQQKITKNQ